MAAGGNLSGKVAVVTGASSGIGAASARLFAESGAKVVVGYNQGLDRAKAVVAALKGSGHTAMHLPLEDTAQIKKVAAAVQEQFGRCDVLVNSAGFTRMVAHGDLEALDDDLIAQVLTANVRGPIATIRAFAPMLKASGNGVIVNISSINAMVPFVRNGPYNISKYAVLALSETLVQELAGEPIRVTCVHPGGIRTNIVRNAKGIGATDAALFDRIARTSPETAAETILSGVEKNKQQVFVGLDAKALAAAKRLFPHWIVRRTGAGMRRLERK